MNMLETIIPKSDQLNADDLIGRTMTIKITRVAMDTKSEQPVSLHFEGDNGKPYKACKSMRRVLVQVWGPDAKVYEGRSLTLYRDPAVKFGGLAVGGIRISHMSHIDKPVTMALTETKAKRAPFTVKPLVDAQDKVADGVRLLVERLKMADADERKAILADQQVVTQREWLAKKRPELAAQIDAVLAPAGETGDGFFADGEGMET